MDDQMGEIGNSELKEKLDDKLWGDDNQKEEEKQVNTKVAFSLIRNAG